MAENVGVTITARETKNVSEDSPNTCKFSKVNNTCIYQFIKTFFVAAPTSFATVTETAETRNVSIRDVEVEMDNFYALE